MKQKLLPLMLVAIAATTALQASEMPEGYYNAANGKSDAELKATLRSIIRPHTVISYGSGTWEVFYYSDRDTATGLCMDMYCDDWKPFASPGSIPSGCNIEHSFAKSWWGGAKVDAYQDCYHLNPSNSTANSARSNYPLGNVETPTKTVGSLKIGTRHHDGLNEDHFIWEPKDEYKGDFARTYFYMATCYGKDLNGNPDSQFSAYNGWRLNNKDVGSRYAMQNDNYLEFQDWEIEVLIQWHRQDPVSSKEIDRADAVNDFQKNRNPFIDYPCLAEYIWGNKKGEPVDFSRLKSTRDDDYLSLPEADKCGCDNEITKPTITTPRNGTSIDFGIADIGETVTRTVTVQGLLLNENLNIELIGTDAAQFGLSVENITAAQALAGYTLTVEYSPTTLGKATAQLVITSSELTRNTTVELTGACGFYALPATDITSSGFTANWKNGGVSEYTLDVYRREIQGTPDVTIIDEKALSAETISGNSHLSISGKTYYESNSLRLGTGNGDGTLTISDIDLTQGATLIVNAKAYGSDNSTLLVATETKTLQTIKLTKDFADYTITIPATSDATITLSQGTSKQRVCIANLTLKAGGKVETKVSVEGFPVTTDALSYQVATTVSTGQPVYYTVTPKGGTVSNEITVVLTTTAINEATNDTPLCIAHDGRIECEGDFRIYDLVGRDVTAANGTLQGIYIVRTAQNAQKVIVK